MHLTRLFPVVRLAALLTLLSAPIRSRASSVELPGYAAVPISIGRHNHIVITLQSAGREGAFSIDTGAPISVLDLRRRLAFDLKAAYSTHGPQHTINIGGRKVEMRVLSDVRAGPVRFGDCTVAIMNLFEINRPNNDQRSDLPPVDGILGSDVLAATGAVLDFPAMDALFRVKPGATAGLLAPELTSCGYTKIPMERGKGGHFTVPCSVRGIPYRIMIDTGAFITLLDSRLLKIQGVKGEKTLLASRDLYGGTSNVAVTRLDDFKIGGVELKAQEVGLITPTTLTIETPQADHVSLIGFLGQDTLQDYGAIIDFDQMNLFLKSRL